MKRFIISSLAVVGILVVGLTTFTSALSGEKRAPITNCYNGLTSTCVSPVSLVDNVTSCATALAQDDKGVSAIGTFFATRDCPDGTAEFCCAKLVQIAAPICATQPRITFFDKDGIQRINAYAKIDAIFCRP